MSRILRGSLIYFKYLIFMFLTQFAVNIYIFLYLKNKKNQKKNILIPVCLLAGVIFKGIICKLFKGISFFTRKGGILGTITLLLCGVLGISVNIIP